MSPGNFETLRLRYSIIGAGPFQGAGSGSDVLRIHGGRMPQGGEPKPCIANANPTESLEDGYKVDRRAVSFNNQAIGQKRKQKTHSHSHSHSHHTFIHHVSAEVEAYL
jgi:hypothetical protein